MNEFINQYFDCRNVVIRDSAILYEFFLVQNLTGFLAVQCPKSEREKVDDILKSLQEICLEDSSVSCEYTIIFTMCRICSIYLLGFTSILSVYPVSFKMDNCHYKLDNFL